MTVIVTLTGSSPGGRFVGVAVGLGSAIDAAARKYFIFRKVEVENYSHFLI